MVISRHSILTGYQNYAKQQQATIDGLQRKLNNISFSRLGLFIAEIIVIALIINYGFGWLFTILLAMPLILFLVLVKRQAVVQKELKFAGQLLWIYQNEIDQLTMANNLYDHGEVFTDEQHPYSSDLDIFGQGSLYAVINRCRTEQGLELLAENLSKPSIKSTILERQEAVLELKRHIFQTYHFRAQLQDHDPIQLRVIKSKLQHELPEQLIFTRNKAIRLYVRIIPFVTFGMLALAMIFGGVLWKLFALLLVSNSGFIFFNLSKINKIYNGFSKGSALLNALSDTLRWTEEIKWSSRYINGFFGKSISAKPLSTQIKSLSSVIQAFDARLNIIVSAFLNLFMLWDLKCSIKLADWHDQSAEETIDGLLRISRFEELIAIATLAYNQPDWTFPIIEDSFHLKAKNIGHPLIPDPIRVVNNFSLSASPTVDIVTGSNMAGKSTFLRTVGINLCLAFAGAPVCAEQLSVSIFKLLSYMRIKDSLNDQTSTFKAELNRLKMILDAIQLNEDSFVLIDEMLRGTNSKDKYLGSKVFIEKLIEQTTPALFATHDLQLSEMQVNYPQQIRNYHFDIQITKGEMNFDYIIKHGPCTTFNAALLLKEIGLTLTS